MKFLKTTDTFKQQYNKPLPLIIKLLSEFEHSDLKIDKYFDQSRNEGVLKSNKFMIVYELEYINGLTVVTLTTTTKIPFGIPKIYSNGLFKYLENRLDLI